MPSCYTNSTTHQPAVHAPDSLSQRRTNQTTLKQLSLKNTNKRGMRIPPSPNILLSIRPPLPPVMTITIAIATTGAHPPPFTYHPASCHSYQPNDRRTHTPPQISTSISGTNPPPSNNHHHLIPKMAHRTKASHRSIPQAPNSQSTMQTSHTSAQNVPNDDHHHTHTHVFTTN